MNCIYNLFSDDSSMVISERFNKREAFLGISKEMAVQKLMLGFFENGLKTFRIDHHQPKACAQLEFFSGSISSQIFRENLQEFMESDAAQGLTPETRAQIHDFIKSSENGAEQAQCVDLIRSQDLRYVLLAKTGSLFWTTLGGKGLINANEEEIEQLNQLTLEKIASLKPGEKASFLTGTFIHETQLAVHHLLSGEWQLISCDSAISASVKIFSVSKEEAVNPDFWKKVFNKKIKEGSEDPFKGKMPSASDRVDAGRISRQAYNTCHTQCQMALLKAFMVYLSPLPVEEASLEWKDFKVLFGSYLLGQKKLENQVELSEVCKIGHQKNLDVLEGATFFQGYIKDGKYEEVKEAYHELFDKCGLQWLEPRSANACKSLSIIQRWLFAQLKDPYLTLDQLDAIIGQDVHPCVQHSLDIFKKDYLKAQQSREKEFLAEFVDVMSPSYSSKVYSTLSEYIFDSIGEKAVVPALADKISKDIKTKGEPIVSCLKQLEHYLALLEQNPQYLSGLKKRPQLTALLVQGIQAGCLGQVEAILSKLSQADVDWFFGTALSKIKWNTKLFPVSVKEYIFDNPESLFCAQKGNWIMLEKVLEGMLYDLNATEAVALYDKFISKNKNYFEKLFPDRLVLILEKFFPNKQQKLASAVFALADHPMKEFLKNVLGNEVYKRGHFDAIFKYGGIKIRDSVSYDFNQDFGNYKDACNFVERFPDHSISEPLYNDLFLYSVGEGKAELLGNNLSRLKNKQLKFLKDQPMEFPRCFTQMNAAQLAFLCDFLLNMKGDRFYLTEFVAHFTQFLALENHTELCKKIEAGGSHENL